MTVEVRTWDDAHKAWDKRSVVIRETEPGQTVVYPNLRGGVRYRGFSLRDEYVIARLGDLQEAVRYCKHHYYDWSIIGYPREAPRKD